MNVSRCNKQINSQREWYCNKLAGDGCICFYDSDTKIEFNPAP